MRTILYIWSVCLIFQASIGTVFCNPLVVKASLSGKITDKESGEGLPGVSVYFPDLKSGTVTRDDGTYSIQNLPASRLLIKVTLACYSTITEVIDLGTISNRDYVMERSVTELSEVVVTGLSESSEQKRNPAPITVVPKEQLLHNSSTNIIDALSREPGVSQVSTGPAISKPVIRGLGYNRVVVLNDGIRQEGQQWGDEHGIEIDEFSVNKVEILKGPASLAYGSDALAGVVNMISFPTLPQGVIKGSLHGNYQSNNGLRGYSGNLSGNLKGFVFDARISGKQAHAYRNKYDGYVAGTKFGEMNYGAVMGLNKSWGYSHLHLSSYNLTTEIAEGERDSATGSFVVPFALNDSTAVEVIVADEDMLSNTIGFPHQQVSHHKAVLNNSFVLGNARLNAIFGWQENHRREFADVLAPKKYELYFLMNTLSYDVRYIFPEKRNLKISAGINGMRQASQNRGEEFLIPEYGLFDIGGFFTLRRIGKKLDMSGGLRYDVRALKSDELWIDSTGSPSSTPDTSMLLHFSGINRMLSNISGSAGLTYQFSDIMFSKCNVSRGFRSPNMSELASNGVHEGTLRYELGNKELKPETSFQADLAWGVNSEHVTFEITAFSNSINNFIYSEKLKSTFGGDSIIDPADPVPAFKFVQGNAHLIGGELVLDIHPHPLDWLHFENNFSYVQAQRRNATDSTRWLPFIPAPKYLFEIKAEKEEWGKLLHHAYVMAGVDHYFGQGNIYSAYGTESETPSYTLINAGVGAEVVRKEKTVCSFFISINNITDVAYQSHLSRLKYAAKNKATGREGVYNMGRNISIKLIVPFQLKRQRA